MQKHGRHCCSLQAKVMTNIVQYWSLQIQNNNLTYCRGEWEFSGCQPGGSPFGWLVSHICFSMCVLRGLCVKKAAHSSGFRSLPLPRPLFLSVFSQHLWTDVSLLSNSSRELQPAGSVRTARSKIINRFLSQQPLLHLYITCSAVRLTSCEALICSHLL